MISTPMYKQVCILRSGFWEYRSPFTGLLHRANWRSHLNDDITICDSVSDKVNKQKLVSLICFFLSSTSDKLNSRNMLTVYYSTSTQWWLLLARITSPERGVTIYMRVEYFSTNLYEMKIHWVFKHYLLISISALQRRCFYVYFLKKTWDTILMNVINPNFRFEF